MYFQNIYTLVYSFSSVCLCWPTPLAANESRRLNIYRVELRPGFLLALARREAQQQRLDGCREPLHGFGTGDQVEGDGKCPSLFKIREPEFGSGKLPLDVGVVLRAIWTYMTNSEKSISDHTCKNLYYYYYLFRVGDF